MNSKHLATVLAAIVMAFSALACAWSVGSEGFSLSIGDPEIIKVWMATDESGTEQALVYPQDATFFIFVDLRNGPADVEVRWNAVDTMGSEFQTISMDNAPTGIDYFYMDSEEPWPKGAYSADVYLNGILAKQVTFEVQ